MTARPTQPAGQSRTRMVGLLWQAWLPLAAAVAIWFWSSGSQSYFFPPLSRVLEETWRIWFAGGGILRDIVPSFVRLITGFALALVLGVALGTILGINRTLEVAMRPVTEALRAIPGAALLPIAMMFLASGETMKLSMIAFISTWPILLNTIEGVRSVDPTLRLVMASFRLSPWYRFRYVFLPAAAPQIMAGARISFAVSVAVMVIVEMFGTPGGMGYFIRHAQQTFQVVPMWTGILMLGLFGYALNVLFRLIERRVLRWHYAMAAHSEGGNQ